ncbi:MAG: hypothetical protein WCR52_11825 [Bacteroidota bacterium]
MADNNTNFDWLSDPAPAFAAQEAWDNGRYSQIETMHVLSPVGGPFTIACGMGLFAEHVNTFRFSPDIIQRLGRLADARGRSVLHESFLNHLQRMRLTVQVRAAAEGAFLLPGEPLMSLKGPAIQLLLLESAIRRLCVESSWYASHAAHARWQAGDLKEEDTPTLAPQPWNPEGWKARALYIGGAAPGTETPAPDYKPGTIFNRLEEASGEALVQIRRLFKTSQPVGDVWLTRAQEAAASISRSTIRLENHVSGETQTLRFTRFTNVYQPVLAKGKPVLPVSKPGYLRQRTLTGMKAFAEVNLGGYWNGWS